MNKFATDYQRNKNNKQAKLLSFFYFFIRTKEKKVPEGLMYLEVFISVIMSYCIKLATCVAKLAKFEMKLGR